MKSRPLHALALCAASFVACKTGGEPTAAKRGIGLDPTAKVAEVDGKTINYGDLQNDKEIGPKLRQAEVKALTDLYEQRRGLLDELISPSSSRRKPRPRARRSSNGSRPTT